MMQSRFVFKIPSSIESETAKLKLERSFVEMRSLKASSATDAEPDNGRQLYDRLRLSPNLLYRLLL